MASAEEPYASPDADDESNGRIWQTIFYGGGLALAVALWVSAVAKEVTGPYLVGRIYIRLRSIW